MAIKFTKKIIDDIFAQHTHQSNVVVALYKLVFPDWDNIKQVHGWPSAGKELNKYIFKKFTTFDKKHHPDVFSSGLWLNNGFSTLDKTVPDWSVTADDISVEYEDQETA